MPAELQAALESLAPLVDREKCPKLWETVFGTCPICKGSGEASDMRWPDYCHRCTEQFQAKGKGYVVREWQDFWAKVWEPEAWDDLGMLVTVGQWRHTLDSFFLFSWGRSHLCLSIIEMLKASIAQKEEAKP